MILKSYISKIILLIIVFMLIFPFVSCINNLQNHITFPDDFYYKGFLYVGIDNYYKLDGYMINCERIYGFNLVNEEYNAYHDGLVLPVDGEFDKKREEVILKVNNNLPHNIVYDLTFESGVNIPDDYNKVVISKNTFFFDNVDEEETVIWYANDYPNELIGVIAFPKSFKGYSIKITDLAENIVQQEDINLENLEDKPNCDYFKSTRISIDDSIPSGDYKLYIYNCPVSDQDDYGVYYHMRTYDLTIIQ